MSSKSHRMKTDRELSSGQSWIRQTDFSAFRPSGEPLSGVSKVFTIQFNVIKIFKYCFEGIHNKNMVQIIHLLVALIRHYRAPIRLPQNVVVSLVVVQVLIGTHFSNEIQLIKIFDLLIETRGTFAYQHCYRTVDRFL